MVDGISNGVFGPAGNIQIDTGFDSGFFIIRAIPDPPFVENIVVQLLSLENVGVKAPGPAGVPKHSLKICIATEKTNAASSIPEKGGAPRRRYRLTETTSRNTPNRYGLKWSATIANGSKR